MDPIYYKKPQEYHHISSQTVKCEYLDKIYAYAIECLQKDDMLEGMRTLQAAASAGHIPSIREYYDVYHFGYGTVKPLFDEGLLKIDVAEKKIMVNLCKIAAEEGDDEAQFLMGRFYSYGGFTEKKFKKAVHFYSRAVNQRHADAQLALGDIHWEKFTPEDTIIAKYYYSCAAKQNNGPAYHSLGDMHEEDGDIVSATKCYLAASKLDEIVTEKLKSILTIELEEEGNIS